MLLFLQRQINDVASQGLHSFFVLSLFQSKSNPTFIFAIFGLAHINIIKSLILYFSDIINILTFTIDYAFDKVAHNLAHYVRIFNNKECGWDSFFKEYSILAGW